MPKVVARDGLELHAERHGSADAPCVLFSCAYTTTRENWRGQVAPLVEAGFAVALWDLRGHGRSDAPHEPAAYTMDAVIDDLDRVAHWASPQQPLVLAGLSFGGLVSLHFALRAPQRVRALVLAGSGPGFKNPEAAAAWAEQTERTARYLEQRGLEAFVRGKAGATCIGREPQLPAAQAAARAILAQDPKALAAFGRGVTAKAPSVIDELPAIAAPALVVVGEHDRPFRRAAEVMAARLPRAQHHVLPGAAHILNIEQSAAFDELLLGFLRALPG